MSGANSPLQEPVIDFFKKANIAAVHRVLERAQKNAHKLSKQNAQHIRSLRHPGVLTKTLNKAMTACLLDLIARAFQRARRFVQRAGDTRFGLVARPAPEQGDAARDRRAFQWCGNLQGIAGIGPGHRREREPGVAHAAGQWSLH